MRMWEIRENYEYPKHFGYKRGSMGMKDHEEDLYDEAYECGYEDGYRKVMKEAKKYYSEEEGSFGQRRMMK